MLKQFFASFLCLPLAIIQFEYKSIAAPPPEETVECDMLVVGGGLAGAAATYEALLAGKTVCMTEITDWVGGQISSQGTSALDEGSIQRSLLLYPRGYLELRKRIQNHYNDLNPGDCWVSESCFLPKDGHDLLFQQLQEAATKGNGQLKWFPSTVIKEIEIGEVANGGTGKQIKSAMAIQHQSAPGGVGLNAEPLSKIIKDAYSYQDSARFQKNIIKFIPPKARQNDPAPWYIIEATETGEIIALADVPYRLGIDPRTYLDPTSSSRKPDPYCTQGFTYTFAMEATEEPQKHEKPPFYLQYAPYYSYELERFADFDLLFTYRRIWSTGKGERTKFGNIGFIEPTPGDISMQNWTWGNDYRPGTSKDNLIFTREQLKATGQLSPGGWEGGLRINTLKKAEEHALGFFYWLVEGTTDSQLGDNVKKPEPNNRFLQGIDSPMGTAHGLSKYPYIREARRIIGRDSFGYPEGFTITEIDISRRNYQDEYYKKNLTVSEYTRLQATLAGLEGFDVLNGRITPEQVKRRKRSTIYADTVGISYYSIDFHPCMTYSPPEKPGNKERAGERRAGGNAYPFQIPLRAMIPQKIDNLLVVGKSIATSHIAAAAYRVHSFEWSSGAAAAIAIVFALDQGIMPYQIIDNMLTKPNQIRELQKIITETNNPIAFPDTSVFDQLNK